MFPQPTAEAAAWCRHLAAGPLQLPVVGAPAQGLSAEDLPPEVEPLWMVRWVQVLSLQRGFTAPV